MKSSEKILVGKWLIRVGILMGIGALITSPIVSANTTMCAFVHDALLVILGVIYFLTGKNKQKHGK